MVTSNHATALIVAKPNPLQIGLRALLIAMPQVGGVHEADDLNTALQMKVEPQPGLVLLDGDVVGEVGLALRRMRLRWPRARFVFLANDVQQEKRASDARADAVLLKGSPPARLVAVLVSLLDLSGQYEENGNAVGVFIQPRRRWLPRFGEHLDAMLRGQGQWLNQRSRIELSYQAMRR